MTVSVPAQGGFPHDPIFTTLFSLAKQVKGVVFHDPSIGLSATYADLTTDVIRTRHSLKQPLRPFLDENGVAKEAFYIGVLSQANYEFAVALFAILALGATVVALPTDGSPNQILDALKMNPMKLILHSAAAPYTERAAALDSYTGHQSCSDIQFAPILRPSSPDEIHSELETDRRIRIPSTRPALVLFSSGSTATPKGVIHSRALLYSTPRARPDEAILVHRPISWIGGTQPLTTSVLSGARAEIIEPDPSGEAIWERLRQCRVTTLTCFARTWEKAAKYYIDFISKLPHAERDVYIRGARCLRTRFISGCVAPRFALDAWSELGLPLSIKYISTELAAFVLGLWPGENVNLERCLGKQQLESMPVKLSKRDHGEILVKGNDSFLGYLHGATAADIRDSEGYYPTGDIAHKEGEYHFFDGRASTDFIKTVSGNVPVQYLEQMLSHTPSRETAYVVQVADREIGWRVGVIGRFIPGTTLESIRRKLSELGVVEYMLPAVLRALEDGEKLPLTHSGKISKRDVVDSFFARVEGKMVGVEVWQKQSK